MVDLATRDDAEVGNQRNAYKCASSAPRHVVASGEIVHPPPAVRPPGRRLANRRPPASPLRADRWRVAVRPFPRATPLGVGGTGPPTFAVPRRTAYGRLSSTTVPGSPISPASRLLLGRGKDPGQRPRGGRSPDPVRRLRLVHDRRSPVVIRGTRSGTGLFDTPPGLFDTSAIHHCSCQDISRHSDEQQFK